MGIKSIGTVVQGRGILSKCELFELGGRGNGLLELFSQFADAQSMMHPFIDKVARCQILVTRSLSAFQMLAVD
jgi:hypothetical protein